MIRIKRVYEPPEKSDGLRVLVDRLWPRGLAKERAKVGLWLRDVAPSDGLRRWFSHDPAKWEEFRARYRKELEGKRQLLDEIRRLEKDKGTITLLFAARDPERNNARILAEVLGR